MAEVAKKLTKETGILKRVTKDVITDIRELKVEQDRLEKMTSGGSEERRIAIQKDVVAEAESSIPINLTRLQKQITAMEAVIKEVEAIPTAPEKELEAAKGALTAAREAYEANKK